MSQRDSTVNDYKKRVCIAMNYINNNLDQDLSLEDIACRAAFSPYHFHRIFKAAVGETITEFTRRLRLERAACDLYALPTLDITSIAFRYNFSSSQNFAKAFRRQFNMSPTEFRRFKQKNRNPDQENPFSLNAAYTPILPEQPPLPEINARIEDITGYKIAYVRKIGRYGKETCEQAFGELFRLAGVEGYMNKGMILSIYWDDPEVTPAERCRTDACITIDQDAEPSPASGLITRLIPAGRYAVCNFEVSISGFTQAWQDSMRWVMEKGYECADMPCFERYLNDEREHPEGKFIVDICIPIK